MADRYSQQDIARAVEILDHYHNLEMAGVPRPYPLELMTALRKVTTRVALEAIIVDGEGSYMLARRPKGEIKYGGELLYTLGGFITPRHTSMLDAANTMIREKHGLAGVSKYVAGPIAQYFWKPGEHPEALNLLSILHVFKLEGGKGGKDVEWFPIGDMPDLGQMIAGRPGVIHREYVRTFHRFINSVIACIDLTDRI